MLTDEEFRLFRDLVHKESGIYLKEARKDFLENRLMKRMSVTAASSPYRYYRLITETRGAELLILLDLLTVNETSFFRNRPQIELFEKVVLPDMMKKAKRLRIWSAGCSTGEEPYTIAMVVSEAMINPARSPAAGEFGWGAEILASDLSLKSLEIASRGEYEMEKIHATVDPGRVSRFFERRGDRYKVKDEIRKMVVFDFHNLKNDNGMKDLDIIFCRNVMIYFNEEEQRRLVEKFHRSLNPGGYLLLGHAESLLGLDSDFEFIYDNRGAAYRKPDKEQA